MNAINNFPQLKHFLKQNILPQYLWLRSLKYLGNKVFCPCCNTGFKKFIEIGPKKDPVLCPRCRSTDRDRSALFFFQKKPKLLQPGMRILHIAPEAVFYKYFKNIPNVDYTAGDKFILQFGNTYPIDTIYIDLVDIPFDENTFDFIYCSHVLEYIKDDRKALQELFRVLKPGGNAIISVPINPGHAVTLEDESITDPAEQERLYGDTGHLRYYGEDYKERVAAAGFVTKFTPVKDFITDDIIKSAAINPGDEIQLSYKEVK
jgi:SAM-dependent methyltransferase